MMTQGVMTQTAQLFGNTTGSVTSKGKQSNSSFDLMMDSNMKLGSGIAGKSENSEVKNVSKQSTIKDNKQESDAANGSAKQAGDATQASAKSVNTKDATQAGNQTQKAEDTKQTEDVPSDIAKEPAFDEATLEKIANLLQAVQQTVMDLLKLTSEELDQLLSEQGLGLVDLLQPENLQKLVLADGNTNNILAVLTDEKLSNTMNQLLQSVEKLMAASDLDMSPEQIKSFLDQAKLLQEGNQVINQEGLSKESVITNQESNTEAMNVRGTNKEDSNIVSDKGDLDKNIQVEVIKVTDSQESSSGTQSDLSKNDNQELKAAEQFEAFLNNLSNTSSTNQVSFNGNMVQVTEIREIANQIIERIRVTIQPEQTSMELQLNPEHLGKVNLSVQSKNGVMTAQFVVQNEISREAIESQLHTLKETLDQQGIKVEAIEVTVAAYSFQQNKESASDQAETKQGQNSHKISLEEAIGMTEETEDMDTQDITGVRGSQIDYTA